MTTVADFPGYPQWTSEAIAETIPGEDHLGIDAAATAIQLELVPGVLSTTDRARYYSFYAWILYRYITHPDSPRTLRGFRGRFFQRHEVAHIAACHAHHLNLADEGGMVGNRSARRIWDSGEQISLDLSYFQNPLGGFGQYYRTAMQELDLIGLNDEERLVYTLKPRGKALAEAYARSIRPTRYARALGRAFEIDHISRDDAVEHGQAACLCRDALTRGQDRQLLLETFFRLDASDQATGHINRRRAFALSLDLVQRARGSLKDSMIRPALYLGAYAPGRSYAARVSLRDTAAHWRMLVARQVYTAALQCLWGAFLIVLDSRGEVSFAEFMAWAAQQLPEGAFDRPLSAWLDNKCRQVGLHGPWQSAALDFDQACGLDNGLDEFSWHARAASAQRDPVTLLQAGTQMLTQFFLRFVALHHTHDGIWRNIADRERLPMTRFVDEYQSATETRTLGEWLESVFRDWILGQHEYIAFAKLRAQGYDTFKFLYHDGRFHRPNGSGSGYREPIRFTNLRIINILTIQRDLNLIEMRDGAYALTSDGQSWLERAAG